MRSIAAVVLLPALLVLLVGGVFGQEATAPQHPARGLELETIAWIDDGAEFLDQRRFETRLSAEERAVDREALLEKALARGKEEGRPVLWYVPRIVERSKRGRQMIRSPILDGYMRQIVWSDADVERIVAASFVPLRMVCDETLCERFGIRALEYLEPCVVFLAPEGEVLHVLRTVRTFDALWFSAVLRDVLRTIDDPPEALDLEAACDRGEFARALELLEAQEDPTASEMLRIAGLKRRLRDGPGALAALDAARGVRDAKVAAAREGRWGRRRARALDRALRGRATSEDPEIAALQALNAGIRIEGGRVLTRLGRMDAAVSALREVADGIDGAPRAEARYLLALIRLQSGDEVGALRRFQKIAQDHEGTVWGRRARANVLIGQDDERPLGAAWFGMERLRWLPVGVSSELPVDTRWPGDPPAAADAIRRGLGLLLAQQRADGGWNDSRYAYCPDARITPNVWIAVTALCCQALLRHRDRDAERRGEIDDALQRGERYLFDATQINRGRNEDSYADAYRLHYLGRKYEMSADPAQQRETRRHMQEIVREAALRQGESGFWAHEYPNAFCTAPVVHGLLAARRAGVTVPDDMLERARGALSAARREDGSFAYGGRGRGRGSAATLRNASTRMPLCESALFALGGSDAERLGFAFENFWTQYPRIEGVRRTDYHSDGQLAGFMFFHALYHTSEAVAFLPAAARGEHHLRLLEKILSYSEIDGTWLDSHELGRSYGTAMALLVLANALEVER